MKYYNLKSTISATKLSFDIINPTNSFRIVDSSFAKFIEPSFEKIFAEDERPQIILVSAVGATGKTTLAKQLSFETKLPLLDLSLHKPVADNTLSGLITNSFNVSKISEIIQSISEGRFGIIIDGVDEGRAKTTEKAFEAFLDDLIKMSKQSTNTAFVLLGRIQTIEECWSYLTEHDIRMFLLAISPFDITAAKKYIDSISGVTLQSTQRAQYEKTRDLILSSLSRAFKDDKNITDDFMSFIGYPPVLDSIGTLLKDESNFFKLNEELTRSDLEGNEIKLLLNVTERILKREQLDKAIPNILDPLIIDFPTHQKLDIREMTFSSPEQCLRILHFCSRKPLRLATIDDINLNNKFEDSIQQWLPEHPFLLNGKIRNAVFEAYVMACVIDRWEDKYAELVSEYASTIKDNYHLIYLFDQISSKKKVPVPCLGTFIDAAMEFNTRTSFVDFEIQGPLIGDIADNQDNSEISQKGTIDIDIDLEINFQNDELQGYRFKSAVTPTDVLKIRNRLQSTTITIPCNVLLQGITEIHLIAPIEIHCDCLQIQTPHLLLTSTDSESLPIVILDCQSVLSSIEKITVNSVSLKLLIDKKAGISYPLVQYIEKKQLMPSGKNLNQKYLRLRRIIVEFRSHSRGRLARLQKKIQSPRVLKNSIGEAILKKLLEDGVVVPEERHYFLVPEIIDKKLGISWMALHNGESNDKLDKYLSSIQ